MSKKFARRSLLYIPGSSLKMLGKAKNVVADGVILDLEDAVSIDEKNAARENVARLLPELCDSGKEVLVRINSPETAWAYEDILSIVGKGVDAIILPKADERSLISVDMFLSATEQAKGVELGTIELIPLFETTYSIANSYEILGVSKRITGVQLGAEDLTKEQGIARTSKGNEILYARQQLAIAGRARNIDILDTPYTGIRDIEGLEQDAQFAKSLGFTGKTCIHPSHATVIDRVFSPSEEEIENAIGVIKTFRQSLAEGKGACMYQNKMIDKPVAQRAEDLLEKAVKLGLRSATETI